GEVSVGRIAAEAKDVAVLVDEVVLLELLAREPEHVLARERVLRDLDRVDVVPAAGGIGVEEDRAPEKPGRGGPDVLDEHVAHARVEGTGGALELVGLVELEPGSAGRAGPHPCGRAFAIA